MQTNRITIQELDQKTWDNTSKNHHERTPIAHQTHI